MADKLKDQEENELQQVQGVVGRKLLDAARLAICVGGPLGSTLSF